MEESTKRYSYAAKKFLQKVRLFLDVQSGCTLLKAIEDISKEM